MGTTHKSSHVEILENHLISLFIYILLHLRPLNLPQLLSVKPFFKKYTTYSPPFQPNLYLLKMID